MIQSSKTPVSKDLVLIGGGHSHVLVLKDFAMNPVAGVQLTVIARDAETPYSGMLPGYVAGHYRFDDVHIDLRRLCRFASARLVHDSAIRIDTESRQVICASRPPLAYDLLSINIGSRPEMASVPGAAEFATPVKPVNRFVARWHGLKQRVLQQHKACRIVVVGAGAAGVEILLSIQYHLQQLLAQQSLGSDHVEFHLVSKTGHLLPTFPTAVGARFHKILQQRGVFLHCGTEVTKVTERHIRLIDDTELDYDELLWVTGASAPQWLQSSGLTVDEQGFIVTNDRLQSTSHPSIFAAGDIAHVSDYPRPKAGVFAVRQGKPLADNLRRALLNLPLKPFKPQKTLLALISTGDRYAIASKAGLYLEGAWLWRWKNWIDRRFMQRFNDLPEMTEPELPTSTGAEDMQAITSVSMRCGGCGAKIGANVLGRVIRDLKPVERADVLVGLNTPDDAAVVEVPAGKVMLHSVDYFRDFIDDPYLFGQICANHSLSDLFAMGASVQSALAIATLPYASEAKVELMLGQLMSGALQILNDAGAALIGGHSSEGAELALGFSVNGYADPDKILNKGGMQPGNRLILSKALGTGTLFAADMRYRARSRWIESALESMLTSNRLAAECFHQHGATACTDVTGFGLLGHLLEMIRQSAVNVEISLSSLPLIEGALETVEMGILSSLQADNIRLKRAIRNQSEVKNSPFYPIIFDPQTSGGLLASVPADGVGNCLKELRERGYSASTVIGRIMPEEDKELPVTLVL